MNQYTQEQKREVLNFFEDGCTAQEIFEATEIPIGTIYRWKHEAKILPKSTSVGEDFRRQLEIEREDLRRQLEILSNELEDLRRSILPILKERQKRRENSFEDADENPSKPRLILGKKP